MAVVSISPAAEACQAIVARIKSGTEYELTQQVEYSRVQVDVLEEINSLRVDVVTDDETQLNETLDVEDRSSHTIVIFIRDKLESLDADAIDQRALTVRQIFQRVNNYDSPDGRVKVWEVDERTQTSPDKVLLHQKRLFVAVIVLRVEVEASL